MKKLFTLTVAFCCIAAMSLRAQKSDWCGTDQYNQQLLEQADPAKKAEIEAFLENAGHKIAEYIAKRGGNRTGSIRIIPTVVHILHDSCAGNISKEQVFDGVALMNEDYQRLNADTDLTRAVFAPYAASVDFEFRLAKIDPNGNPTNGITRTHAPNTTWEADDDCKHNSTGGKDAWPTDQYFNIWLVNTIGSGGSVLGYAQFPGWGPWNEYGYVSRHDRFGRLGTAVDGRTATHEAGHCFGLFHTFQDGCGTTCHNSGDDICDTPPVAQATWNSQCDNNENSCANDGNGTDSPYTSDVQDQTENYMSYDDCQNMFTQMQVDRMQYVVDSGFAQLINLVSSPNLTATGVDRLMVADFSSDKRVVCEGDVVALKDRSEYEANSWSWSLAGAASFTSTMQNPTFQLKDPGLYNTELEASDGTTDMSEIKTGFILVAPSIGTGSPFAEGFENATALPDDGWMNKNMGDSYGWELTTAAAYSGTKSVKAANFGSCGGEIHELISSSVDLRNLVNAEVSFRIAYAMKTNANTDYIALKISDDCGASWANLITRRPAGIYAVEPDMSIAYVPSDTSEWVLESIGIPASYQIENTMIKFVFESSGGNNLYIDDINIEGDFDSIPVLAYPYDQDTITTFDPILDWRSVGVTSKYEYQVDEVNTFNSSALLSGTKNYTSVGSNDADTEFQMSGTAIGQTYFWRVRSITNTDTSAWSETWSFTISKSLGLSSLESKGIQVKIYPNPLTDQSIIQMVLKDNQKITVDVFNILGRRVKSIRDNGSAGVFEINLSKKEFGAGVYFVKITAGNEHTVKKVVVN